jgi:hypothetical protein
MNRVDDPTRCVRIAEILSADLKEVVRKFMRNYSDDSEDLVFACLIHATGVTFLGAHGEPDTRTAVRAARRSLRWLGRGLKAKGVEAFKFGGRP